MKVPQFCALKVLCRLLQYRKTRPESICSGEDSKNVDFPNIRRVLKGKLFLTKLISSNSKKYIFLAQNMKGARFVVKTGEMGTLTHESNVYREFHHIANDWGISKMLFHGEHDNREVIILEYLGPSLKSILKEEAQLLTMKECIQIAMQIVYRLETIHNVGYIHGDIEPGHVLLGRGDKVTDTVFMVGFSNSVPHANNNVYDPTQSSKTKSLKSYSKDFASIARHERRKLNRKDDLESFLYLLAFMCKRKLPWDSRQVCDYISQTELIKNMKSDIDPNKLFEGLPAQFVMMYEYVKSLRSNEKPIYHKLRVLLSQAFHTKD